MEWFRTLVALVSFITASGNAVGQETVLYAFRGPDGALPDGGLIFDAAGNLYGATAIGGLTNKYCSDGCGTVFKLTKGTKGKWTETVLHAFRGLDGSSPIGPFIFEQMGNLYGTTVGGGKFGGGTVFKLSPQANEKWSETVLHHFNYKDGEVPNPGLIFDSAGALYGTTAYGGKGVGTVFRLTPSTNGKWTETVLHDFQLKPAATPYGGLAFDALGNLYGTTSGGGRMNDCPGDGCGIVFSLSPSQTSKWIYHVLHQFNAQDGDTPSASLIVNSKGSLYGTTSEGGADCGGNGCGVVFKLTSSVDGWKETVLNFFNGSNGQTPFDNVISDSHGNLYGTTAYGGNVCQGSTCGGVLFVLTQGVDEEWTESVLYNFGEPGHGRFPSSSVIFDSAGNLYGTTSRGGNESDCPKFGGCGIVFEVMP